MRSDPAQFQNARRWVERVTREAGWPAGEAAELGVALMEACANIYRYAYCGRDDGMIELRVEVRGTLVRVCLTDFGKSLDLAGYREPDLSQPREGGYGLMIMRRLTDSLSYVRSDTGNRTVMIKTVGDEAQAATDDVDERTSEMQYGE
jgi:serine/threonine-protein kinase RsbW